MPTTFAEQYFPVAVQIIIALAIACGLIGVSALLGKKVKSKLKDTPYECGMAPTGSAAERF
ncbi:MAG: NADH-quinone oxidoreductase subunit A, partial [Bryobacteraceae bacterium]